MNEELKTIIEHQRAIAHWQADLAKMLEELLADLEQQPEQTPDEK